MTEHKKATNEDFMGALFGSIKANAPKSESLADLGINVLKDLCRGAAEAAQDAQQRQTVPDGEFRYDAKMEIPACRFCNTTTTPLSPWFDLGSTVSTSWACELCVAARAPQQGRIKK